MITEMLVDWTFQLELDYCFGHALMTGNLCCLAKKEHNFRLETIEDHIHLASLEQICINTQNASAKASVGSCPQAQERNCVCR